MTQSNEIQVAKSEIASSLANQKELELPSPNRPTKVLESQPSTEQQQAIAESAWESNKEEIQKLVDDLNNDHLIRGTSLNFSIDDETNSLVVKVLDKENNKIIRQIPSDEILQLKKHIKDFLGTLIDKKV